MSIQRGIGSSLRKSGEILSFHVSKKESEADTIPSLFEYVQTLKMPMTKATGLLHQLVRQCNFLTKLEWKKHTETLRNEKASDIFSFDAATDM